MEETKDVILQYVIDEYLEDDDDEIKYLTTSYTRKAQATQIKKEVKVINIKNIKSAKVLVRF